MRLTWWKANSESDWTPQTSIGEPGTRLIYLFLIQAALGALAALDGLPNPFYLLMTVLGIASIVGILTRSERAPWLIIGFLAAWLIIGFLALGGELLSPDQSQLGGPVVTVIRGIVLPIAWFGYFQRRRGLFIGERGEQSLKII